MHKKQSIRLLKAITDSCMSIASYFVVVGMTYFLYLRLWCLYPKYENVLAVFAVFTALVFVIICTFQVIYNVYKYWKVSPLIFKVALVIILIPLLILTISVLVTPLGQMHELTCERIGITTNK